MSGSKLSLFPTISLLLLNQILVPTVSGIRRDQVVSAEDLKLGVPGSIPSRGTMVMVKCPWGKAYFLD